MPQSEASILRVEGKDDQHAIGHLLSRGGDHVTREPQEAINERKQGHRQVGYEQRFRVDATLDDLDLELAREFLALTPVAARPVTEALSYYRLIEQAAQDWRVTNAALLLFARAPALRWHPRAGLRLFRVEPRRPASPGDPRQASGGPSCPRHSQPPLLPPRDPRQASGAPSCPRHPQSPPRAGTGRCRGHARGGRGRLPSHGGQGQGCPIPPRAVPRRARESCEMSPESCAQLPSGLPASFTDEGVGWST